jgi:succinoglycan biosynthesis protein ExoO
MLMPKEPVPTRTRAAGPGGDTGTPDVSFIVPTHNVAPFIEAALASALSQTGVHAEIIVSDDASSDATPDMVARLAESEPRITLLRADRKAGPSAARNRAIAAARGHWLAMLDGDDMIAPERSRVLMELAALTDADMVADSFRRFGDGQRPDAHLLRQADTAYSFAVDMAAALRGNCAFGARGVSLGAIKPMIRRAFWTRHQLSYRSDIAYGEDFLLLIAALQSGARFVVTSHSLYHYRIRRGSQSVRLGAESIAALVRAHDDLALEVRHAGQPDTLRAARAYRQDLQRAGHLIGIADKARAGHVGAALRDALRRPDCWRLLAHHAGEAALKRLRGRP